MEKVTGINSKQVDQQTIDTLKGLLGEAESGNLRSILFIDKYRDGRCGHGWAGKPDTQMIGRIEELKFDYHSQMFFPQVDE